MVCFHLLALTERPRSPLSSPLRAAHRERRDVRLLLPDGLDFDGMVEVGLAVRVLLEEHRRTPEGRVRTAAHFLSHFFPTEDGSPSDRVFSHMPKEVRGPILSGWGIRDVRVKGGKTRAPTRAVVDLLGERMPNATVATLKGAGHMSPFTHPDEVSRLIINHLATQR